jgi:uncharacterized protein
MELTALLAAMTPDIYQRFKTAVELRKWPNGDALSAAQLATCMQAIIAYEAHHVAPEARVGYIPPKTTPCADDAAHHHETPIKWQ